MNSNIITIVTSVSSVLGLISLIAYLIFLQKNKAMHASERSLINIVEGEGLIRAQDVILILRTFRDESKRLEALEKLIVVQNKNREEADRIYKKIKNNIDLISLNDTQSEQALIVSRNASFALITIAVIGLILVVLQHSDSSSHAAPNLSIGPVEFFQEKYAKIIPGSDLGPTRPRHTLTKLEERSGTSYDIVSPETFFLPFGFVINGLQQSSSGAMDADIEITGLANDGGNPAWTEIIHVDHPDKWKAFDIPKEVGAQAVIAFFDAAPPSKMPFAVVEECLDVATISRWSGEIQMHVQDHENHNQTADLTRPIVLKLTRMSEFIPPKKGCTVAEK